MNCKGSIYFIYTYIRLIYRVYANTATIYATHLGLSPYVLSITGKSSTVSILTDQPEQEHMNGEGARMAANRNSRTGTHEREGNYGSHLTKFT